MRRTIGNKSTTQAMEGFTLVELIVMLVVLAVAVGIALPSYRNLVDGNQLRAATRDMVSALQLARSEALTRRQDITLDHLGDSWNDGWKVDLGDKTLRWRFQGEVQVEASANRAIEFIGRTGFLSGGEVTFTFCYRNKTEGKKITVSKSGLVETVDATCG